MVPKPFHICNINNFLFLKFLRLLDWLLHLTTWKSDCDNYCSETYFTILVNVGKAEPKLFYDWALANCLSIKVGMTFCCIFGNRSVDIHAPNFFLDNVKREANSRSRYLGIILDDKLKNNHRITSIAGKISKSIGVLYKLQSHLPSSCLKLLISHWFTHT